MLEVTVEGTTGSLDSDNTRGNIYLNCIVLIHTMCFVLVWSKLELSTTAKVQRIENLPPSGISIVRDAKTVFMVVYINRSGGPGHEGKIMS